MCGITAYLGKSIKITEYLVKSLKILQSRGYDSAGICFLNKQFNITKTLDKDLDKLVNDKNLTDMSNNGLGHTRWSTHGKVSLENTHPFIDNNSQFMLIHNGIISNAHIIKKELIDVGIVFESETDSEVIVQLISYMYNTIKDKTFNYILEQVFSRLEGCWSVAILKFDEPHNLYLCNNETPLLIGFTENSFHISSDFNTFTDYTLKYIQLNNKDVIKLNYNSQTDKINNDIINNYKVMNIDKNIVLNSNLGMYKHWLHKEIMEQPSCILNTLFSENNFSNDLFEMMKQLDNLIIIGSGTSYHAGLMGEIFFKNLSFMNVQCFNASDFDIFDLPRTGNTGFLFISQSGETKDIFDLIVKLKKLSDNYKFISITNSHNSLIPRNCDFNLYLNLTKEISVASTKTFTSSVLMLYIFAYNLNHEMLEVTQTIHNDVTLYSKNVFNTLRINVNQLKKIAKFINNKNLIFLSSSKLSIPIVKEINLKFQELCYTFSIASGSKNLKHGPLALISNDIPVFYFASNEKEYFKTLSVANEVKSRGGYNILISSYKNYDKKVFDDCIQIPESNILSNLLTLYPMQLLVYYLCLEKGYNADLPKNLAKTCTV